MSAECVRKRKQRNENPLNTQLLIKKKEYMKRKRIQQQQQLKPVRIRWKSKYLSMMRRTERTKKKVSK